MKDLNEELRGVVASLKGHLVYQRDILLAEGVPVVERQQSAVGSRQSAVIDSPQGRKKSNKELLEELMSEIGDCQRCKLGKTRTKLVFGVGNPDARIVFVGEGPGREEDLQGEPFVGRAGQLLTDIITKGMSMQRGDVYICNVVKCRPPENRNPEPDEIAACEPF